MILWSNLVCWGNRFLNGVAAGLFDRPHTIPQCPAPFFGAAFRARAKEERTISSPQLLFRMYISRAMLCHSAHRPGEKANAVVPHCLQAASDLRASAPCAARDLTSIWWTPSERRELGRTAHSEGVAWTPWAVSWSSPWWRWRGLAWLLVPQGSPRYAGSERPSSPAFDPSVSGVGHRPVSLMCGFSDTSPAYPPNFRGRHWRRTTNVLIAAGYIVCSEPKTGENRPRNVAPLVKDDAVRGAVVGVRNGDVERDVCGSDGSKHAVSVQGHADYAPNWVAEHLGASSRRSPPPLPRPDGGATPGRVPVYTAQKSLPVTP